MSRRISVVFVAVALFMFAIPIVVLLNQSSGKRTINGNMNCLSTYNLPVGERLVGATDHELLTTVSPNTEAKTYHLRAYSGDRCYIIQER